MAAKIVYSVLAGILISASNSNAQDIRFGFLGGIDITYSTWRHYPNEQVAEAFDYDPMVSFNINGHISYKTAGALGFSLEPGFMQKGGKGLENNQLNQRVTINYLQMPILIDFYILDRLFVSVGPEIAYLAEKNYANPSFELSGLVGVNYNIIKHIDLGLRYNHGLTYFTSFDLIDDYGNLTGTAKEYNQYLQFIIRFKF